MMPAELKLITERTRHVIDAANHTLEYSKTVIEQSKKLILGINEKRLQREAAQKRVTLPTRLRVTAFVTMPPVWR